MRAGVRGRSAAELAYRALCRVSPLRVWPLLEERLANQWLTVDELERLHWWRLRSILEHCHRHVRFYADLWREHGVDPSRFSGPEDMRHLPVVTRAMLSKALSERRFPALPSSSAQPVITSGTTEGRPFSVLMDRPTYEKKYANHLRQFYAAGWRLGSRSAALHHCGHGRYRGKYTGETDRREPWHLLRETTFRVFHRRTVLRPYVAERTGDDPVVRHWYRKLRRFSPRILDTFYINLLMLSDYAQRSGREQPRIPSIFVLNSLTDEERRRLQELFGAEVFNRYSPHEAEGIAFACSNHVGMHVAVDCYRLEVVGPDSRPLPPGETGRILVTDLENHVMPLIRYDIGDLGRWLEGPCSCGRELPRMGDLEGRFVDRQRRVTGDAVSPWQVERTLQGVPELRYFQVVGHGSSVTLSAVAASSSVDRATVGEDCTRRLRHVLGEGVPIRVEWREGLPLEPNGKYRFVKNGAAT